MQAIITKYLGPTNTRGARVKASCQAGSVTVPWDHTQGIDGNHTFAAYTLAKKFGWSGSWVGGATADDSGEAFVCVDRAGDCAFKVVA